MAAEDVASPGPKLGQIVGVLLEQLLGDPLRQFAIRHQLYCDCKGSRPAMRSGRKVTWIDSRGNRHDLDYVLERGGSAERRGDPLAFIESAWRRYTKHSRNKSGELEGALLPLRASYTTVRFLGAILAGEWSEGGLQQLRSASIEVLHLPFQTIVDASRPKRNWYSFLDGWGHETDSGRTLAINASAGRYDYVSAEQGRTDP